MRVGILGLALMLLAVTLAGAVGAVATAPEPTAQSVQRTVTEEALRRGFPPSLALAVADAASGFNPRHLSGDGARGVMQLHPRTARAFGSRDPEALWDARVNARLGIAYLEALVAARRGDLPSALADMERGVMPDDVGKRALASDSAFAREVLRLQRRYRSEAQGWAEALKGAPVEWDRLRPHADRLDYLARLARRMEGSGAQRNQALGIGNAGGEIERRRRAVLPYLDDFSG